MNVLMLGWEYPPHIAGGLGTACEGLTKALGRQGTNIQFVIPKLYGDEDTPHMRLVSQDDFVQRSRAAIAPATAPARVVDTPSLEPAAGVSEGTIQRFGIPANLMPYWSAPNEAGAAAVPDQIDRWFGEPAGSEDDDGGYGDDALAIDNEGGYNGDIFQEVARFSRNVVRTAQGLEFDLIHAHDWMTYAAGVAVHQKTGKPLVVHVHSLEYDRSGNSPNPDIHYLERHGLDHADAVIAVSHYTREVIAREYGVADEKIYVVHNGIYPREAIKHYTEKQAEREKSTVLFLGRVTHQKGPDYFVRAAAKVVPHVKNVRFVLAGSGDMLERMKALAHDLGISDYFEFPGFLKGQAVEEMFSLTDLYVMPSVSEPFGISALEAINFDVPALISRQSGVSEVVNHSLKFDYWDTDRLASLIINGLIHEELRVDMRESARRELEHLRWDESAAKTLDVYQRLST